MKSLSQRPRTLRKEVNLALDRMNTDNVSMYLPGIKDDVLKGLKKSFYVSKELFGYIMFKRLV